MLEDASIKLSSVASSLKTVSARAILHESAGKQSPAGKRQGNKWLTAMLVEAAGSVGRMHGKDYLAAQHARLMRRRGMGRAQVAVAHSMLVAAYWMLKRDEPYHDLRRLTQPTLRRSPYPTADRPARTPRPHGDHRPSRLNIGRNGRGREGLAATSLDRLETHPGSGSPRTPTHTRSRNTG